MMRRKLAALAGAVFGLMLAANPANAELDLFSRLFGGTLGQGGHGTVRLDTNQKPGTIIISTSQRRLYYTLGDGTAISYGVGVGRRGFEWSGTKIVSQQRASPDWAPPPEMLRRRPPNPAPAAPPARAKCRGASTIRWARAHCISARRCTAFMARTSRRRL